MKTLKKQVEHILKNNPETRNSDIRLTIAVWITFYSQYVFYTKGFLQDEPTIRLNSLYYLPNQDNIKRIRANFQNKKKQYLPTIKDVAKKRGWNEEEWRKELGY